MPPHNIIYLVRCLRLAYHTRRTTRKPDGDGRCATQRVRTVFHCRHRPPCQAPGQQQNVRVRSPEKASQANRDRSFSGQANLGQVNFGQSNVRHENPGRDAGIHALSVFRLPTEIVYHPIPLPKIRLPLSPRDDCLGTITKPDVGMTDSAWVLSEW